MKTTVFGETGKSSHAAAVKSKVTAIQRHQTIYNWKHHITYTCTLASSNDQYSSHPCTNAFKKNKYYTHED
jgi:hypothetical protein